jgi:hypothetical protein
MQAIRFSAVAAIIGAIAFGLFIEYFASGTTVINNVSGHAATSTGLATLPSVTLPLIQLPVTTSTTSTSTVNSSTPKQRATPESPVATPVAAIPASAQAPVGDIDASASEIRAGLVNIICESPSGSGLASISGSGVIIDPRGIILTNAHIGQYFLLANRGVSCVVRTGSPAQNAYYASPAFVSPAWLSANSSALIEAAPTGTGEYDIAILVITSSATDSPLPNSFPYVPLGEDSPVLNEPVVIGSYAAQFLQSSAIANDLFPTIVYGSVQNVFTFQTTSVDVVSLGGSAAAQEGSSGGGVVDASGELTATITTSTTQGETSSRELNAITASYIRRDYIAETGLTISTLLSENPSTMVSNFAPKIPSLEAIVTADLPH